MEIIQIKETCLYCKNLHQAYNFYHTKLGFPIINAVEGRHIFFRAGSSILLCFNPEVTKNEDKLPPHFAYGRQHIAFEVHENDYPKWLSKIKNLGIGVIHEQEWKNAQMSFYFHDPEGHVLEIVPKGIWEN